MITSQTCPRCGGQFTPQGGLKNLCPKCLMQCAFEDSGGADENESDAAQENGDHPTILYDESAAIDASGEASTSKQPEQTPEILFGGSADSQSDRGFAPGVAPTPATPPTPEKRHWNFRFRPGDRVLDGYTILGPLGHGGFGEVYHSRSDAGKEVALKLVQRYLDVELRGVGHCLNLKHQNLVTIYDVRPDSEGQDWIVMEFVAGESLAYEIDRHPEGLPPERIFYWLEGIIAGVEHLHQAGIVHRDLKPSNIFEDHGTVKVGDYGLSKFITASRRSGQTQSVGTLHYMAPEIGGGRYGREVDVYAVGVMLYEMLTGDVPFDGQTPTEILMKHLTATPDVSKLPTAYRGVVARMLAKHPEERYGSLQAALIELQARLADASLLGADGEEEPSVYGAPSYYSAPGASTWLEDRFAALLRPAEGRPHESADAEPDVSVAERQHPQLDRRYQRDARRAAYRRRRLLPLFLIPIFVMLALVLLFFFGMVSHRVDGPVTATVADAVPVEIEVTEDGIPVTDVPMNRRLDPAWGHSPWPPNPVPDEPHSGVRRIDPPFQLPQTIPNTDNPMQTADSDRAASEAFAYSSSPSIRQKPWSFWIQGMAALGAAAGFAFLLILRRHFLSPLSGRAQAISEGGPGGESLGGSWGRNQPSLIDRLQTAFGESPFLTWVCLFLTISFITVYITLTDGRFDSQNWGQRDIVIAVFFCSLVSGAVCLWGYLLSKQPQLPREGVGAMPAGGSEPSSSALPEWGPVEQGAYLADVFFGQKRAKRVIGLLGVLWAVLAAVFWGVGSGLLTAGICLLFSGSTPWRHETAGLWGGGVGFFVAAVIITRCLVRLSDSPLLRLFVSLFWGAAAGLAVAGGTLSLWRGWRFEELAVCFGFGAGLLMASITAGKLFAGRPQWLLGRVLAALMASFAIQLLGAGFFVLINERMTDGAAIFFCGMGFTMAAAMTLRLLSRTPGYWLLRFAAALVLGGGVGALTGSAVLSLRVHHDVAALVGMGTGFLTCGISVYLTLMKSPPRQAEAMLP